MSPPAGPILSKFIMMAVMASWSESRHPEWDLMYTAGLTAREIADLCHRNIATVHLHLKNRQKYQESFEATHQAALASRHPDRPSTRWRSQFQTLRDFVEKTGRLPRSSETQSEITLHNWRLRQLRSYESGEMSPSKIALLNTIPNWNINQRETDLNQNWEKHLNDVLIFVQTTGRFPRYRNFDSADEHRLGVWLHNQHQRKTRGLLDIERREKLDKTIPGWARTQTNRRMKSLPSE